MNEHEKINVAATHFAWNGVYGNNEYRTARLS
jgi:hypothetical protein